MQTPKKENRIPELAYNSSEQKGIMRPKAERTTNYLKTTFRSDFKWTKLTASKATKFHIGQTDPEARDFTSHMFHYLVFCRQTNFCSYIVARNYLFFIQMNATDLKIKHKKFCHSPKNTVNPC